MSKPILFFIALSLLASLHALPSVTENEVEITSVSAPAAPAVPDSPSAPEESCVPETIQKGDLTANFKHVPALGVLTELTSCVFSNVGLITEKNALLKEEERLGSAEQVRSYKLPMWWVGFMTFVLGQILSGVALTLMSVVVVTPLGSFTVIVNIFTSYFFGGERTSAMQIVFSLCITAGCVLTTLFAPWSKASDTLECFRVYMQSTDLHIVAAVLGTAFFVFLGISRSLVMPAQNQTPNRAVWPKSAKIARWLYPVCAGLVSVWTINIGAALIRLFSQAIKGKIYVMESYEIYVVAIVYVLAIMLWQNMMNASMFVLDAAYVVPIHFALFTMMTLPVSGSLHGTLANWNPDPTALAMYLSGCSLNVVGMLGLLLVGSKMRPKDLNEGVGMKGDEDHLLS